MNSLAFKNPDDSAVVSILRKDPKIKAALAADEQRIARERRENASLLAALHNRAGAAFQQHVRAEEEAIKAAKEAHAALQEAGRHLMAVRARRMNR